MKNQKTNKIYLIYKNVPKRKCLILCDNIQVRRGAELKNYTIFKFLSVYLPISRNNSSDMKFSDCAVEGGFKCHSTETLKQLLRYVNRHPVHHL